MSKPLPGQLDLFSEEVAPAPVPARAPRAVKTSEAKRAVLPGEVRPKTAERAGAVLDHRFTEEVKADGLRANQTHGLIDRRQRVYQCGGEARNFVYQRLGLVTMAGPVWGLVVGECEWLEWIDHELNQCWRITTERASALMECYEDGIGWRVGFPVWAFDVISHHGEILRVGQDVKPLREVKARKPKRGLATDEPEPEGVKRYACGRCWRKFPEEELVIVEVPLGRSYCCPDCFERDQIIGGDRG